MTLYQVVIIPQADNFLVSKKRKKCSSGLLYFASWTQFHVCDPILLTEFVLLYFKVFAEKISVVV